jgi:hypothetical protein
MRRRRTRSTRDRFLSVTGFAFPARAPWRTRTGAIQLTRRRLQASRGASTPVTDVLNEAEAAGQPGTDNWLWGFQAVPRCSRSVGSASGRALGRCRSRVVKKADRVFRAILPAAGVPYPIRRAQRTRTTRKRRPCESVPGVGSSKRRYEELVIGTAGRAVAVRSVRARVPPGSQASSNSRRVKGPWQRGQAIGS